MVSLFIVICIIEQYQCCTVGGSATLSPTQIEHFLSSQLSKAIMEAVFGKQRADWQENDVSWMSHYTHTHRPLPELHV